MSDRIDDILEADEASDMERPIVIVGDDIAARLRADLRKVQPYPEGTIVRFESVANNGVAYVYAAVFAGGSWWLTGTTDMYGRKHSNESFMGVLTGNGHRIRNVSIATAFEKIEL